MSPCKNKFAVTVSRAGFLLVFMITDIDFKMFWSGLLTKNLSRANFIMLLMEFCSGKKETNFSVFKNHIGNIYFCATIFSSR